MFGYTNFAPNTQQNAQKSARAQNPNRTTVRRESTNCGSASPAHPRPAQKKSHPQSTDNSVSERYTNRAYNRQPSPMGRLQRPAMTNRGPSFTREERATSPQRPRAKQPPISESRSVIIKPRPLEAECSTRPHSSYQRVRPKTVKECPALESKVMIAVKEVLSRAVIEKGKIDENNIDTILQDMQSRLDEDGDEESTKNIDVEVKRSNTKVNVNTSTESFPTKKGKPLAGIVRRDLAKMSSKRGHEYKKVYNRVEPSVLKKEHSKKVFEDEQERIVYIDLPDPDYSNFNSLVKQEEERVRLENQQKAEVQVKAPERKFSRKQVPCEMTYTEEVVGDCYGKEGSQPFACWRAAEDEKLQAYIESLIRNMNDQLNGRQPLQEIEEEIESQQTVCKSFCVCKVCVSNKPPLQQQPSHSALKGIKQSEVKLKSQINSSNHLAPIVGRARPPRMSNKDSNTDSHFKVLKRNQNFDPESKVNLSPRHMTMGAQTRQSRHDVSDKGSYTVVGPCAGDEPSEDMYLQRRISKSPVKRRMSTKI